MVKAVVELVADGEVGAAVSGHLSDGDPRRQPPCCVAGTRREGAVAPSDQQPELAGSPGSPGAPDCEIEITVAVQVRRAIAFSPVRA